MAKQKGTATVDLFIVLTSKVPLVLDNCTLYADDTTAWSAASALLEQSAASMAHMADTLGLALNPSKTQHIVFRGGTKCLEEAALTVSGATVRAKGKLEFLGWSVDHLNPTPFIEDQISALKSRVYLMQQLSARVPPAVLGPVARVIFNRKAMYAVEHSHAVRLTDTDPLADITSKLQVVYNDMSRVILRKRRADRLHREDLSFRSGIPSVNQTVFARAARLAWQAMNGPHPAAEEFRARVLTMPTRAAERGLLRPVDASSKALAFRSAVRVWNWSPDLRAAPTRAAAEKVVKKLMKKIPF